jgi:MFS family permease
MTFPLWPLIATTAMQTVATMAAYTVPALAPVIARDLGVDGALTGYFVSVVYGVGIASSLLAADLIHRYGAVRVSQLILAAALAMLLIGAHGGLAALALGAIALGIGYGATAPVSTHLLVPRTPPRIVNLVLSIRQIGVPLGGVLGALLLPPIALSVGWQNTLLLQALPVVLLLILLEVPRRQWDHPRGTAANARKGGLRQLAGLLRSSTELRCLTLASFVYSGAQLCFVAFTTVQLTSRADFGLIAAGQALATYQICGVVSRPIWGWIADTRVPARWLLVLQGFMMAFAAGAAGQFGPAWPVPLVLLVCALAGVTASGYTGIAYGEFARLGGPRRTEATGLGSAAMFAGVLVLPSLATVLITTSGSYGLAYGVVGAMAAGAGLLLATGGRFSKP